MMIILQTCMVRQRTSSQCILSCESWRQVMWKTGSRLPPWQSLSPSSWLSPSCPIIIEYNGKPVQQLSHSVCQQTLLSVMRRKEDKPVQQLSHSVCQQTLLLVMRQKEDQGKNHFTFESFSETPVDPQKDRIFSYQSVEMKASMKDDVPLQQTTAKFYQNHIFHSTRKYQVPVRPEGQSRESSHHSFYRSFQKFTKPYGEMTKFSDSVVKNGSLLRRGPCDIPVSVHVPKRISHSYLRSKKGSRFTKGVERENTLMKSSENTLMKSSENTEPNLFDKTVDSNLLVFKRVFAKERAGKKDSVDLNNSMNRLLAAQTIQRQLNTRPHSRSKTDHR